MKFYHFIWALLPLILCIFFLRAAFGQLVLKKAAEHTRELFSEFIFCTLTFTLALFIDIKLFIPFTENLDLGFVDPAIFNWLLYPAVLTVAAFLVSKLFPSRDVVSLINLRKNIRGK